MRVGRQAEQKRVLPMRAVSQEAARLHYVRPHELTLDSNRNGPECLEAKVLHVNPTGSRAKVELRIIESDQLINAELTAERFSELALKSGDTVFVSARRARVFMPNPPA
jgi:sulfate transport system ATP-binding protein